MRQSIKSSMMLLACLVFFGTQAQDDATSREVPMTPSQWQEDLRFFQKTIHQDYPFLFKKITADDFDKNVEAFHGSIPDLQEHEIMVGMCRMVAQFGYGHTIMGYWEEKVPVHQLPVVLYHYDDGIFLQGVHRDYKDLAGTQLIAIDGVPVEEAIEKIRPVIPIENEMFFKAYGIHYLTFPEFLHAQGIIPALSNDIPLTLKRGNQEFVTMVKAAPMERFPRQYGMVVPGEDWVESRDTSETPLYLKDLDRIYYYQYLPEDKTVYIRHSQIQDDPEQNIPAFYKEVFEFVEANDVEKLILDVRLNGGGNNYKNKPIVTGLIRSKINTPGSLMVIIGRRTFSACQNLVNEIHTYTNAVFVGEPTGENINFYGDNRPVTLPNSGMNAYLSFAWWQDKPQWENDDWLAPQIATGMTFEQYRTNQDPALEAALQFSDTTFVTNPMAHLTELFTRGELDRVKSEAIRMISDPIYAYFDFEAAFNKAAENLLGDSRAQEAFFVSSMTAKFFPDSPQACLTHGKVLMALEQTGEARTFLEKVVKLDPEGEHGVEASALLELE